VILIFGSPNDTHVQAVCQCIGELGERFVVVNHWEPDSRGFCVDINTKFRLILGNNLISLDEVRAVWWRVKPNHFDSEPNGNNQFDDNFTIEEWRTVWQYISFCLGNVPWVNDRNASRRASNKLLQLQMAAEVGLEIPDTLVTNNPTYTDRFVSAAVPFAVFKTLTPYMAPSGHVTYTTKIESGNIGQYSSNIQRCPSIYQKFIEKEFELRVNIVGDSVFAVRIDTNSGDESGIDWRRRIDDEGMYSTVLLDKQTLEKLTRLHSKLGLIFGCYDLVKATSGETVFLEVNPSGQWLWLEQLLDIPISSRLAATLCDISKRKF
jgi:hypothetical protein